MIARSDRVVSHTDEGLGDEVCAPAHSGSTAPTIAPGTANRWGAKAKPPVFFIFPAALLFATEVSTRQRLLQKLWD
jgi:hypothetical protein